MCPPKTIPESSAKMLILLFYVLKRCFLRSLWLDRPSLSVSFKSGQLPNAVKHSRPASNRAHASSTMYVHAHEDKIVILERLPAFCLDKYYIVKLTIGKINRKN